MSFEEKYKKKIEVCEALFLSGKKHEAQVKIARIRDEMCNEEPNSHALLAQKLSYLIDHLGYKNKTTEEFNDQAVVDHFQEALLLFDLKD